jgi:hypothetical protein
MTNNPLEDLFGPTISQYTDDHAVEDGTLVPFIERGKDTLHRVTRTAWEEMIAYHRTHNYPEYSDAELYRFFYAELQPLVSAAHHGWNHADILKTDYTFDTRQSKDGVLWYVPNERGGITIMLPEDY